MRLRKGCVGRTIGAWGRSGNHGSSRGCAWHAVCELAGMSKPIPTIQKTMTTSPHSVGQDQPLTRAHAIMREHHIRHLPVLHGGKLVGVLSERDLALIETLKDVDATKLTVAEAMSTEVYSVGPDSPLDEVASEMASKKYGSAVVLQNGHVVGIVTTVDICRVLAELLHGRLAK